MILRKKSVIIKLSMKFSDLDQSTQIILKIVFVVLALFFLWLVREIIVILLLALVVASAMDPMVDYFNKKKIPRAVSVLTVYILVLGIAVMVIYLLIPPVLNQLQVLQKNWPQFTTAFEQRLSGTPLSELNLPDLLKGITSEERVVTGAFGVFSSLFSLLTMLIISFYLVAEEKGMKKFIASLIPLKHQDFAMNIVEKIQRKMGFWVLGQIILSFVIFVVTFIGLKILGVQYALFLAMLAGLLEIIPYLGPILSSIPAIFFAFIQNPPLAIVVVLLYVLIQKTENYILVPKIMEKTVGASPLVILLALLVGFKLAGIIGVLVAVPLVAVFTVVIDELVAGKQQTS